MFLNLFEIIRLMVSEVLGDNAKEVAMCKLMLLLKLIEAEM
jgi:hypothetical protein